MTREENIVKAQEAFGNLIREDYKRIDNMKQVQEPIDFEKLDKVTVGILPGDGIGPVIMPLALDVMEALVGDEIKSGKIEIRHIEGMTIENRVAKLNSLPDECMEEIKKCQVLLKGPMVTPRAGDGLPNLVSANSLLRRGLDLYAAVRPIDVPEKNIHWTFFRENIEGEYIWGNKGIQVDEDLAVDTVVAQHQSNDAGPFAGQLTGRCIRDIALLVQNFRNFPDHFLGNFFGVAVQHIGHGCPAYTNLICNILQTLHGCSYAPCLIS